jgi:hypothetical protein
MNRRELLTKLALGAPALVTLKLLDKPLVQHDSSEFMYKGWRVKWSGWIGIAMTDAKVGRWFAYSPERLGFQLFSSYPGGCGSYYDNMTFDVSLREWQTLPTERATPSDLAHYRSECLQRLMRLIDKCGPPPLNEAVWLD